ncbi:MAG: Rieske 2Fe-2S domain-containing protein [Candidatus Marinimicrobia bacterium]|jgi:nitrite reductase/ring-hydroxylating ferredoxin subunit|nr:Rieske 2Fe-2S domain-containing protein [Candidatus Neomarinimicrobiota bacterium]
MAWIETIPADELKENEMKQVVLDDGHKIALIRKEDGYHAIEDTCSHAEASLAEGEIVGDRVRCPLHGAEFEIKTGDVKAFPAVVGVEKYDVKVEDNRVLVNYGD